jgi:hypothetical protein
MPQYTPVWNCADGVDRAAAAVAAEGVTAKTAAYTVLQSDTGKIFTNSDATGPVTFTLPTPFAGLKLTFIKATVAQNLILQCPTSVSVDDGSAAAKYQNTTSEMGTVTIVGISTRQYAVLSKQGTWAAA